MRMKNELANQYMLTFSHFRELSGLLSEPKRISNEMREASQVNKLRIGKVSARLACSPTMHFRFDATPTASMQLLGSKSLSSYFV